MAADLTSLPYSEVDVAVIDLEMTGLSPEDDRICEIAIVRGCNGRVEQEFQSLVRPGVPMTPGALRCHGIRDVDVADAPTFAELAPQVMALLEGAVMVAHNAPFDLCFLQNEMSAAHAGWVAPPTLDTLLMARRLFAFNKNNLGTVCARLDVELEEAHRALSDARATFGVFTTMMRILDPTLQVTLEQVDELLAALAPNSPLRLSQKKTIRQAWHHRHTVWIDYQSTTDPSAGLVHREVAVWFLRPTRLQAWCHLREGERVFRLDRIRTVEEGATEYDIPDDAERRI